MLNVAIIGRPNVGKSTLFNKLVGKRVAITDDKPGVTRDSLEETVEWLGKSFKLFDTPGFDLKPDIIKKEMQIQFLDAIQKADLVVFIVDVMDGVHPLDQMVLNLIRERQKNFIVTVNKVDNPERELLASDFYSLGIDSYITISAAHSRDLDVLLDYIIERVPETDREIEEDEVEGLKMCIVGRPNVGKSSLINAWLDAERVIVTDIAGTTIDSVYLPFTYDSKPYVLVDTAGIRKKSVMFKDHVEKISYFKSQDSLENADVTICVIDAEEGLVNRDVKVIGDAWEAGKPILIAVNKWDLIENPQERSKEIYVQIKRDLAFLNTPFVVFISTVLKKNIFEIFGKAEKLFQRSSFRIPTAKVNKILEEALIRHNPPVMNNNRRLRFYYMTQVSANPPTFAAFANYPDAVHSSYQRFITNVIREFYDFKGVPIRLFIRQRGGKKND